MKKRIHPALAAIIAHQENKDLKAVIPSMVLSSSTINTIVSETELMFDIILNEPYEKDMTVGDLALIVSKARKFNRLCTEIQSFAQKIYGLDVALEQEVVGKENKSKLNRVASCYIIKEKVPRKEKAKRMHILQAQSLKQIVERILY